MSRILKVTFERANDINMMTNEQVEEYLSELRELIYEVEKEIEYVEEFGATE